jgi:hypothetical protein
VNYASITIRQSVPSDFEAVERLAALDSGRVPSGRTLVALENGEIRAVLPLDGSRPLADPFHPTAELVEMLRVAAVPEKPRSMRIGRRFGFGLKRAAVVSGA